MPIIIDIIIMAIMFALPNVVETISVVFDKLFIGLIYHICEN